MHSYSGKCLVIDLTTQKAETRGLPEGLLRSYLGGVGLGTRLLMEWVKPGTDPLSPNNALIFASSGLAGTMAPATSNHALVTKSPLTGFLSDSVSSGRWSLSLKRAGYDAIVVTGAASSPVYVFVDNEIVHFGKADHLSGESSPRTSEAIRRSIGDDRVQVASIGPAGENLVSYACIDDGYPPSHRGGAGAVMGSKKLKAIAIRGTKSVSVHDLHELERASVDLYARAQTKAVAKYRGFGTLDNLQSMNRLGALPTRNFRESSFEQADNLSGEYLATYCRVRANACPTCPIACEQLHRVPDGLYSGTEAMLDYQSLAALGPLCGISDIPAILKAVGLCQLYGMDTVSTGSSIAWAMESFEEGAFTKDDTEGIDLSFGNSDAMLGMVERIGKRNGLGKLLAEGTKRASAKLGRGSAQWAMHSKGLELSGCDPRSAEGQALWSAIGLQAQCHDCCPCWVLDMDSSADVSTSNKDMEDLAAISESLMICHLMRGCFNDFLSEGAYLYALATGIEVTPSELKQAGERINNLKKAFNIREGWRRIDDWLPPRLFEEARPPGKKTGNVLSEKKLEAMIDDYYRVRGWTAEGLVPIEKLETLRMDDILETVMRS